MGRDVPAGCVYHRHDSENFDTRCASTLQAHSFLKRLDCVWIDQQAQRDSRRHRRKGNLERLGEETVDWTDSQRRSVSWWLEKKYKSSSQNNGNLPILHLANFNCDKVLVKVWKWVEPRQHQLNLRSFLLRRGGGSKAGYCKVKNFNKRPRAIWWTHREAWK